MRVLAVRQPWASLIIEGLKTIEVRSKLTEIRERIAIYASTGKYTEEQEEHIIGNFYWLRENKCITPSQCSFASRALFHKPRGKIIGTVEIVASATIKNKITYDLYSREHLAPQSFYKDKTYFWDLRRPVKFSEPIEYTPKRGAVVWSNFELPEIK